MSISGSGWGSAGKVVASDTRGPRFESSRLLSFYWTLLVVSCVEKTIIKKKRPGMGHFLKKNYVDHWIWTQMLRCQYQPLCQLCHNHCCPLCSVICRLNWVGTFTSLLQTKCYCKCSLATKLKLLWTSVWSDWAIF